MARTMIGYGVHRTEHKGTRRWFTAPILEGEPVDRYEKIWYGPDAKQHALDWAKEKAAPKENEKRLAA